MRNASYLLSALVLAVALPAVPASGQGYEEIEVADGGTIRGRVYFESELPERRMIQPSRDNDTCGIRVPDQSFEVDRASKGLANVVLRVEGITRGKPFADAKPELAQIECRYQPRVMVVRPGSQVEIVNQDPILHNVHAYRGDDTVFNMAQPFQGQRSAQSMPEDGVVRVVCDVHDWMRAYILVLDNPYVAISGKDGSFEIDGVPPGTYKVTMWHELLGTHTKEVTVPPGGTGEVDFIIAPG